MELPVIWDAMVLMWDPCNYLAHKPSNVVAVNIPVIYIPGMLESHTDTLALFICIQPEPGYRNGEHRFLSFSTIVNNLFQHNSLSFRYQIADGKQSFHKLQMWNGAYILLCFVIFFRIQGKDKY